MAVYSSPKSPSSTVSCTLLIHPGCLSMVEKVGEKDGTVKTRTALCQKRKLSKHKRQEHQNTGVIANDD